jgi:malate/lactate dehydrogenase
LFSENESVSTWIQVNASLVEDIVSQVCMYSPHATLIICTQPNELMTYVAWRVSQFPSERILGLGASVETAYAHKTIRDQTENIHGRVNGFFILGNGRPSDSCATVFTNHLTINGICCSDIMTNQVENKIMENQSISKQRKFKDWDLVKILEDNGTIYSDISRRLPIITDLISRQKTAIKYLLSNCPISHSKPKPQRSIEISLTTKPYSNWTEAMLIVHIIRALINNNEFQSNFAVNIAPMNNSNDVFINYPTILGSSHGVIKYMFPFRQAQNLLQQRSFLIPYEKFQRKIRRLKSKD